MTIYHPKCPGDQKILFLIAAVAFLAAPLSSCKKSSTVYHIVKFYAQDGKFADGVNPHEVEVEDGAQVAAPESPTITDGVFENWYTEPEFTTVYKFDTPVTSDINLYAKYTSTVKVKVTFNAGKGTFAEGKKEVVVENITPGSTITAPETAPTLAGGAFTAWFSDKEFTKIWDFGTAVVTTDTTLYAAYTMKEYVASSVKIVTVNTMEGEDYTNTSTFSFVYDEQCSIKSIYMNLKVDNEEILRDTLNLTLKSNKVAEFYHGFWVEGKTGQQTLRLNFLDETYTCAKDFAIVGGEGFAVQAEYNNGFLSKMYEAESTNERTIFVSDVELTSDKKSYSSFSAYAFGEVGYEYKSTENHSTHIFDPAVIGLAMHSGGILMEGGATVFALTGLCLAGYFGNSSALIPDTYVMGSGDKCTVELDDNLCPKSIKGGYKFDISKVTITLSCEYQEKK